MKNSVRGRVGAVWLGAATLGLTLSCAPEEPVGAADPALASLYGEYVKCPWPREVGRSSLTLGPDGFNYRATREYGRLPDPNWLGAYEIDGERVIATFELDGLGTQDQKADLREFLSSLGWERLRLFFDLERVSDEELGGEVPVLHLTKWGDPMSAPTRPASYVRAADLGEPLPERVECPEGRARLQDDGMKGKTTRE